MATKIAVVTALLALLAAILNIATAFKPYTWLYDRATSSTHGSSGSTSKVRQIAPGGTAGGASPAAKSVPPTSGLRATEIAAETAVSRYFDLARNDDVAGMWNSTSPAFQATQSRVSFEKWWGPGIVDVQGPLFSYGTQQPVHDVDGGIWVQFAVRFMEDHIGAKPHDRGWVNQYDVYWYKVVVVGARQLIDRGRGGRPCPFDLTSLAACESAQPLPV